MAEGGFPNRNRADNALTIYRDAMRAYIAPALERKHGPNWFRSQVLNDDAHDRNPNSYARREQSLKRGTPAQNLIDLADIPFLIEENRDAFPDLDQSDTRRMHMIRDLRNEIHHADRIGDCAPEEAESLAGLCTLVVERCGLSDAVEGIRHLSSDGPGGGSSEADLREQRERREWDKARLAGKRPEELTPLEQQRLADIEWEEEWERRELVRREREEIARFGDDINGLRLWFDADEARHDRHTSEHTALLQREEARYERERAEIAALGDDIDDLRRWFDAVPERQVRHPSEHATLLQRDQERPEQERLERVMRNAKNASLLRARLSGGGFHSVGLCEDGTAVCWGDNEDGQCDAPPGQFIAVSAGGQHSAGLRDDGTVVCWGDNEYGQCDAPPGQFIAVSAGDTHNVALRSDGTTACWGMGPSFGRSRHLIAVSAGCEHTVGLRSDGKVICTGENANGQCDAPSGQFVAISAGHYHSVGLRSDGTVVCWGGIGVGSDGYYAPEGQFIAVSAGNDHNVGLRSDGTVVCWGDSGSDRYYAPAGQFIAVSAGSYHSVGLRSDGTVVCWGGSSESQAPPERFWVEIPKEH